jgi:hypothetical protein
MDRGPGVLIANQRVQRSAPSPRLNLLIEWEPRHRVFLSNLADLLWSRPVPPILLTSRPARFWGDVFVPSGAPWSSFIEALLLHSLLIILLVWAQSKVWVSVKLFPTQQALHRSITYYPPRNSFPAAEGRASVPARSRPKHAPPQQAARQAAIPVTPERKPNLVTPPDIKQAMAKAPDLAGSRAVAPIEPLSAANSLRRNPLAGSSSVVAPAPQVDQASTRKLALPQASAVAPAPDLNGPSIGRAAKPGTTGAQVVPPPPSVQVVGSSARAGMMNSLSTATTVVAPPPTLQGTGKPGDARLNTTHGVVSAVVPPPPSVQGTYNSGRAGKLNSLSGGSEVVAPPPSVQGTGNPGGSRLGSMGGADSRVVPPPPSVQAAGGSGRAGKLSSLAGGPGVIAPPPSVQGTGRSGDSRLSSMGGGSEVVAPAPSGESTGGTRMASLSGPGTSVVPPPPSVEGSGSSGAGGRLGSASESVSGNSSPAVASSSIAQGSSGGVGSGKLLDPMDPLPGDSSAAAAGGGNQDTEAELPLGIIGVVFAPQGTSYFSNFEVFVAKRKLGKDQIQLIKLVYEFLPYQRRLSEYDLNNLPPRVIKLRVTPDPSCNESLGQMILTHSDSATPAAQYAKLPEALRSSDLTAVLPCYRTSASDFQRAMSRSQ